MYPAIINKPAISFRGKLCLPGDKSISHRAIFIGSLAQGKTKVSNFLFSQDCLATIGIFRNLGVKIKVNKKFKQVIVYGRGILGLAKPKGYLYIKESGTTLRLLAGILAGQNFRSLVLAGRALSNRPMLRICEPLRLMGAKINTEYRMRNAELEEYPPLEIIGGGLRAITYKMPVASAQVKSAILLAGLYAKGKTCVIEDIKTRDHTERMLKLFGADITRKGLSVSIAKSNLISPANIGIPADISSAAFFIVLAALLPDSDIIIKAVGLNSTRAGIIRTLKKMGAKIKVSKCQSVKKSESQRVRESESLKEKEIGFEPMADIRVKNSKLKAISVAAEDIPAMIDELPIFMVAASLARGKTVIEGAQELRIKETDRINSMVTNLTKMGVDITLKAKKVNGQIREYIEIIGVDKLRGASLKSFGDHRTAMSLVVAGLCAEGKSSLDDVSCINKSFPEFIATLKHIFGRQCVAA